MPTTASMIAQRYRLERVVGRGGMGEVWLAQDVVLGRQVAAKRIGARGASDRELRRAQQEARVTAMLDHEHVVRVFDLVVEQGEQWLVMELVESENLARLVRRTGPLDAPTAARLAHQAAQALAAAHQAGIVHRDVKPSNLLVTPSWHVKLGDFGIARLEGDSGTTRTGQLIGSPSYLAPEVGVGRPATPASDMWSLGATLFHALEGHAPYDTDDNNVMGILYRVVNDTPPVPRRGDWLAPVVGHLMVHDPESRWTAHQLVSHLDAALAKSAVSSPRPSPGRGTGRRRPPAPPPRPDQQPIDEPTAAATSMLPVVAPAVTPAAAPPVAPVAAAPVGAAAPATARDGDDRPGHRARASRRPDRRWRPVGAALAAVVVVVVAALLLVPALRQQSGSRTPSAGGEPTTPSASSSPTGATAAGIEAFVRSYLSTAPADPRSGFDRLTPAYQAESKGLSGYESFWGKVTSATATRIDADPADLTVAYGVDYRYDDGTRNTDDVRLQLTMRDGKYLIAGEK